MTRIDREALKRDQVRESVRAAGYGHLLVDDATLEASLDRILATRVPGVPVWIFAYGSLVWSPTFHSVERVLAEVHGYHRGFYLWSFINRGSPDRPGLVLALDRGGSCSGVAYRLAEEGLRDEMMLLWRREMIMTTYQAKWVTVRTPVGTFQAVAFVVDRTKPTYAGRLDDDTIVDTALAARGHYGPCEDYLCQTATSLAREGIADRHLERLMRLLERRRAESGSK